MTITKEEAYDIISDLNEDAHSASWDTWVEADELSESDDEEDWTRAEEMRSEASDEQAGYFRAAFHALPVDQQNAIWKYAKEDDEWAMDFKCWYGEEEYETHIEESEEE